MIKPRDSNRVNYILLDDVEYEILHNRYVKTIDKMRKLFFNNNKEYKSFIDKIENLYMAYKGKN